MWPFTIHIRIISCCGPRLGTRRSLPHRIPEQPDYDDDNMDDAAADAARSAAGATPALVAGGAAGGAAATQGVPIVVPTTQTGEEYGGEPMQLDAMIALNAVQLTAGGKASDAVGGDGGGSAPRNPTVDSTVAYNIEGVRRHTLCVRAADIPRESVGRNNGSGGLKRALEAQCRAVLAAATTVFPTAENARHEGVGYEGVVAFDVLGDVTYTQVSAGLSLLFSDDDPRVMLMNITEARVGDAAGGIATVALTQVAGHWTPEALEGHLRADLGACLVDVRLAYATKVSSCKTAMVRLNSTAAAAALVSRRFILAHGNRMRVWANGAHRMGTQERAARTARLHGLPMGTSDPYLGSHLALDEGKIGAFWVERTREGRLLPTAQIEFVSEAAYAQAVAHPRYCTMKVTRRGGYVQSRVCFLTPSSVRNVCYACGSQDHIQRYCDAEVVANIPHVPRHLRDKDAQALRVQKTLGAAAVAGAMVKATGGSAPSAAGPAARPVLRQAFMPTVTFADALKGPAGPTAGATGVLRQTPPRAPKVGAPAPPALARGPEAAREVALARGQFKGLIMTLWRATVAATKVGDETTVKSLELALSSLLDGQLALDGALGGGSGGQDSPARSRSRSRSTARKAAPAEGAAPSPPAPMPAAVSPVPGAQAVAAELPPPAQEAPRGRAAKANRTTGVSLPPSAGVRAIMSVPFSAGVVVPDGPGLKRKRRCLEGSPTAETPLGIEWPTSGVPATAGFVADAMDLTDAGASSSAPQTIGGSATSPPTAVPVPSPAAQSGPTGANPVPLPPTHIAQC